jgi:hypothetical protein
MLKTLNITYRPNYKYLLQQDIGLRIREFYEIVIYLFYVNVVLDLLR